MREFVDKFVDALKEREQQVLRNVIECKPEREEVKVEMYRMAIRHAVSIANKLLEDYEDWILCSKRLPSKEECRGWRGTFQATILLGSGDKRYTTTVVLQYEYTTVRGKEVSRWLFKERIAPWEPIAWKPLSEPYQL